MPYNYNDDDIQPGLGGLSLAGDDPTGANAQQRQRQLREQLSVYEGLANRSASPFGYSSAIKGGKGQLGQISKLMEFLSAQQTAGFSRAEGELRTGMAARAQGFQDARSSVARIGDVGRQRVMQREGQALGGMKQSLIDRGLTDSSVALNLERGVRSDTGTALAEIDRAIADIDSGLLMGQGNAAAQDRGALAQLFTGQAGAQTQLGMNWADILANIQHQNRDSGNLGDLFGSVLGAIL